MTIDVGKLAGDLQKAGEEAGLQGQYALGGLLLAASAAIRSMIEQLQLKKAPPTEPAKE